jgi:hypothetical protein
MRNFARGKVGNDVPILFITKNSFFPLLRWRGTKNWCKSGGKGCMYIKDWCNQSSSFFYYDCFVNIQTPLVDFAPTSPNIISLWFVLNIHRMWPPIVLWRIQGMWTAVAQWLRYYAPNRKVTGSIPNGVIGIFHSHNPFDCTLVLGSTQPLTEMSIRNISWGVKADGA